MIYQLKGRVEATTRDMAIIDVAGVGYGAFASTQTLANLRVGESAALHIITHVREDHIHLYGFLETLEREWFEILTGVQGVGPRVALGILGAMSPADLANALMLEDRRAFQAVSGVGPKMAARLVTELKDKGPKNAPATTIAPAKAAPVLTGDAAVMRDLISALTNLGYDDTLARQAAATALESVAQTGGESGAADLNALIPLALKALAG